MPTKSGICRSGGTTGQPMVIRRFKKFWPVLWRHRGTQHPAEFVKQLGLTWLGRQQDSLASAARNARSRPAIELRAAARTQRSSASRSATRAIGPRS